MAFHVMTRLILETDPTTVANRVQMKGADDGSGDGPNMDVSPHLYSI